MLASIRSYLLILGVAGLCIFLNLGAAALFEEDEPKNAECGREMFVRGDWLVPTYNEELRTDKPILLYWLMLSSFHLFGMNEFAARFPSALMSTGTLLLVCYAGNRIFKHKSGLLAGVIAGTSIMFNIISRASTPDGTLIFFISATLIVYLLNIPVISKDNLDFQWPRSVVPESRKIFLVLGLLMGLAVLAKGPVGILLPCLIMGFFVVCSRLIYTINLTGETWLTRGLQIIQEIFNPIVLWRAFRSLRPELMIPVALLIALPWYIAVTVETNGAWLEGFLGKHNVGRFLTPMEKHSGPFFYYLPVICIGFFPWSMFLIMTVYHTFKFNSVFKVDESADGKLHFYISKEQVSHLFIACWIGFYVAFFSCAQTKLPNYVLPIYPALALLTAAYLTSWKFQDISQSKHWMNLATYGYGIIGVTLSIILVVGFKIFFPEQRPAVEAGLILLLGSLALWYFLHKNSYTAYVNILCVMGIVFSLTLFSHIAPRLSQLQDGVIVGRVLEDNYGENAELGTYQYFSANLPFYAERKIHRFQDEQQLQTYLEDNSHLLVIKAEAWPQLQKTLPQDVRIIKTVPRFLRRHDLLLIGSAPGKEEIAQERESTILK